MSVSSRRIDGWWTPALLVGGVLALTCVVWLFGGAISTRVAQLACINIVLVVGLYTFSGLSGILSFGHMTFAAIGAYVCAFVTIPPTFESFAFPDFPSGLHWLLEMDLPFPLAIVFGGAVAGLIGLLVSPTVVRLSLLQGAIATLAILMIGYTVLRNWTELTRGSSSMIGVPSDLTLGLAVVVAVIAIVIAWSLRCSNVGLRLRASRDDVAAARSVGVPLIRDRTLAWTLSAFLTGMGGALYAHFITTFSPDQFYLMSTFMVIAMLVVGGMRTLSGAVVGTVVYSLAAELLRRLVSGEVTGVELPAGTAEVALAALLLVIIIKRPLGIVGAREIPAPAFLQRQAHGASRSSVAGAADGRPVGSRVSGTD